MFIKLCGFTRIEDIKKITGLPVSAAGFIFHKKSKRYVEPEDAGEMALLLKEHGIRAVGVFVEHETDVIIDTIIKAHLDMVQVYNGKTAEILSPIIPVIECARIGDPLHPVLPEPRQRGMVLFDTYSAESYGGTGKSFNLDLVSGYPFRDRMIVAGGVNETNVKDIIRNIRPGGIDISSGIEISEGIKSRDKILRIMEAIEETEHDNNA